MVLTCVWHQPLDCTLDVRELHHFIRREVLEDDIEDELRHMTMFTIHVPFHSKPQHRICHQRNKGHVTLGANHDQRKEGNVTLWANHDQRNEDNVTIWANQ